LPPGVSSLEHTADTGLEVRGASLAECLARAAAGLFSLMFAVPAPAAARRRLRVQLEAESPEGLMVAWLEELLYRSEVGGVVFTEFEVQASSRRLRADVRGVPLAPEIESAGPAVKGVTWHALRVERRRDGWRARVILDV